MPWWEYGAAGAAHEWAEAMSLATHDRRRLDPGRLDRRAVERWRNEVSDDVVRLLEAVGWEGLGRHGYRPVHARGPLPPTSLHPACLAYAGRRRVGAARREARDMLTRRRERKDIAARWA